MSSFTKSRVAEPVIVVKAQEPLQQIPKVQTLDQIPDLTRQVYASAKAKSLAGWYASMDIMALATGFLAAWKCTDLVNRFILRHDALPFFSGDIFSGMIQFVLIAAGLLIWFEHTGHYHLRIPLWIETKKILSTMVFAMMAHGFLQFAYKSSLPRLWLVSAWIMAALVMLALRYALRSYATGQKRFQRRTLLVGAGETAKHIKQALQSEHYLTYTITAQLSDLPKSFLQAGKSWETLCAMNDAEYVIVALDPHELAASKEPLAQLVRESVPFSVASSIGQLPVTGMAPHYFMNHDVMLMERRNELDQALPCCLKRMLDIAVSASALVVLSPLMLVLALWIKSDGGPAFYAHTRLGRDKKSFPCIKFRSMSVNGDAILERHLAENPAARAEWESSRKLINDPRITRVGRFLRSSSLDELPQLINVLRGDMSLVGPRPIVNAEVAKYNDDIAHYYRVRPGVTGLWQVSGRSDVSYPRRVQMDSWYVRNWSLWHDIAILCKTFPALLSRKGAY